jgi:hypothetical protein
MSGIFLKDGAKVALVNGEAADDLARIAVRNAAEKAFRCGEKKFSRMTFLVFGREISAWDSFCHSAFRSGGAVRNRIVSDFLRHSVVRSIGAMSDEMRWVIELTACDGVDDDEEETLNRAIVLAVIQAELMMMIQDHGQALQAHYHAEARDSQPIRKGASPL